MQSVKNALTMARRHSWDIGVTLGNRLSLKGKYPGKSSPRSKQSGKDAYKEPQTNHSLPGTEAAVCQNEDCSTPGSLSVKVCHHTDCQEKNSHQPLKLCSDCDKRIHDDSDLKGHLRLDLGAVNKHIALKHVTSTKSLPGDRPGERGHYSDPEDETATLDARNKVDDMSAVGSYVSSSLPRVNTKLRRKPAIKNPRRHHTDDDIDRGDDDMGLRSKSLGPEDFPRMAAQSLDRVDGSWSYDFNSPPTGALAPGKPGVFKKHSIGKECCTINFDKRFGEPTIEIIAALNGVTLRDALSPICEKRGLDLAKLNVYLDASSTALPLQFDTFRLGGVQLHIKVKDGEDPFLGKSVRGKSNGKLSNADKMKPPKGMYVKKEQTSRFREAPPVIHRKTSITLPLRDRVITAQHHHEHPLAKYNEDTPDMAGAGSRPAQRSDDVTGPGNDSNSGASPYNSLTRPRSYGKIQGFFGTGSSISKSKQDALSEKLNTYSVYGVPPLPELLTIGQPKYEDSIFELESHWTSFVDNPEELTKKQRDQQEALWELFHTEVEYIKSLKLVSDLFSCCLINLQNEQILNEIETEKLFSNVSEIWLINCHFWMNSMRNVVLNARLNRTLMNPSLMKAGFLQFEEIFHPYTKYCLEHKQCQDYYRAKYRNSDLFKAFVVWAEAQKQCHRLKLNDLLVKPMQRLTKYALLLRAVLKKTECENTREDLKEMIESVDRFVKEVDATLRKRHEQERLAAIITRIESYDAIEAPNEESFKLLQEYSNFDLSRPMPGCLPHHSRHLLLEKPLRLKESTTKAVTCFLFTDMFLVTKPNKRDDHVRIVKPPMRVDKIVAQELKDGGGFTLLYLNEFQTASAAYTFYGDGIKLWIENIKSAQKKYRQSREEATRMQQVQFDSLLDVDGDDDDVYLPVSLAAPTGSARPSVSSGVSSTTDGVTRQISAESAEGQFLPNLSLQNSVKQNDAANYNSDGSLRRKSSSSHQLRVNGGGVEPRARSFSTGMLAPPSLQISTSEDNQRDEDLGYTPQFLVPVAGITPIPSPFGSPSSSRRSSLQSVSTLQGSAITEQIKQVEGGDSTSTDTPLSPTESHTFDFTDRPGIQSGPVIDDSLKGKLNQRRTCRTEKRYHTADAIRDMNHEKDNSIHKRLSWNLGTMDINIEQERSGILKNKAFSSESLRSIRSSSGVSSNGSLHLSPESEISEECELVEESARKAHQLKHSESDVSASRPEGVTADASHPVSPSKSRSLSDLSGILSELSSSKLEDGIGSVGLPPLSPGRKNLSYAEILRMKKQLLLNSNAEASEV